MSARHAQTCPEPPLHSADGLGLNRSGQVFVGTFQNADICPCCGVGVGPSVDWVGGEESCMPGRFDVSMSEQLFDTVEMEQGTDAWLEWRYSGIGASEASTVMGDNRFESPAELLNKKLNRLRTEPNEKMRLGTALEPEARERYVQETGIVVEPRCLQSKEHSWLIASMDGISETYDHAVEIKCGKSAYGQAQKGHVPSYYYGQLQHQLMITGLGSIDYWCYWPGCEGILQTVGRDDSYIERLFRAELAFMERLNGMRGNQYDFSS